jgi:hypothetical protein
MLGYLQPGLIHLREERHQLVEFQSRSYLGGVRKSSAPDDDGVRLVLPLCSSILTEISRLRFNKCNHVMALMCVL